MSGIFQNILKGGSKDSASGGSQQDDSDFADFSATSQQPAASASTASAPGSTIAAPVTSVPYTKWYRVWERTSPKDFMQEAFILPFILFIVIFHVWGTRKNRRKAKAWAQAHIPVLHNEFAVVGYKGVRRGAILKDLSSSADLVIDDNLLREKAANEFTTYATGRQNVAFVDVTIQLVKRYNPMFILGDSIAGMFFDSLTPQTEKIEVTAYSFDGKEKDLVPAPPAEKEQLGKGMNSTHDGFVFAIVNKTAMRRLREDRYDVSLTFTKDNPKLPEWVTVMSESAEITDTILTNELIKAIEDAGDLFEYLIITDQPADKPAKVEEAVSRKRSILSMRVPSSTSSTAYASSLPLFHLFIRLTDRLAASAHFRPEVLRKLRATREEEVRRLRRATEDEKAEERKLAAEKVKKEGRDRLLRGMSAEEQRKYLEKEKERETKKEMKKYSRRA
ncbi:hypothetical protein D8B26_000922 [Coccidioides posadasii str. Silveira]|uniref:DUF1682 domain-containing protein n=2 Tax=Coccidioides posadasii TaxID=199306 RepID=A0A0J6HYL5_COCPO|nr:hypothetical protein CPC735_040580 [Coccidioides posadasii C735 delta SOWgp]EER28794.1 hypothetical protein CPC735_040580 [Coccidioides posadasii C735 delta SOWgp]KMM64067.1 hypothetical protein CPAG_00419 [Coccidioides posadasii RMSCC 3488]QVM06211.1 hypothetical protein D8B26_000922 [Coccidioides posadasii str. Silveira]|eukprot:XP_003070939.1 hypothetical protein CPC735_040580 [Coccidioides posadasii C735 delta SOWgp]